MGSIVIGHFIDKINNWLIGGIRVSYLIILSFGVRSFLVNRLELLLRGFAAGNLLSLQTRQFLLHLFDDCLVFDLLIEVFSELLQILPAVFVLRVLGKFAPIVLEAPPKVLLLNALLHLLNIDGQLLIPLYADLSFFFVEERFNLPTPFLVDGFLDAQFTRHVVQLREHALIFGPHVVNLIDENPQPL